MIGNRVTAQSVLVVGATGFIGRHVIARLVDCGHHVFATRIPNEAPVPVAGVTWLASDLSVLEVVNTWPTTCDSIIYLAQSRSWRMFPDCAADVFQLNVAATLRVVDYARQIGAQRFIFASTGSIYTQTVRPAREDEMVQIQEHRNFHFASKLAAELLLGPFASLLPVVILRLFVPYGPGQSPDMLIPQLIQRVRDGRSISLHGQDGMRVNPVAVADVVDVLRDCLLLKESATCNVAGPEVMSLREIGMCIGKILGISPKFECHPDQVAPVRVGRTDTLRTTLGRVPNTRFEDGLRSWFNHDPENFKA